MLLHLPGAHQCPLVQGGRLHASTVHRASRPRRVRVAAKPVDSDPPTAAAADEGPRATERARRSPGRPRKDASAASDRRSSPGSSDAVVAEPASKRRPLFGTASDSSSSSRGDDRDDQLQANVWSILQGLKPVSSRMVMTKPPDQDLASSLRQESAARGEGAGRGRGGRGGGDRAVAGGRGGGGRAAAGGSGGGGRGAASSRGAASRLEAEGIDADAPPPKKKKGKPPAPLPPALDDPKVQESLQKLAAGDFMATKWLVVAPPGLKRDVSRRQALGEERVEEIMDRYRTMKPVVKIGRRGVTEKLRQSIVNQWRSEEVCKLRIHDERSSRNANMPRMNLVYRELEVMTGGVLLETTGKAMWLYRGDNYVQPPTKRAKKWDTSNNLVKDWKRQGEWHKLGNEQCYVVGDASLPTAIMLLPDMFDLKDSQVFQVCDRIAAQGHLVVMPDLLQPRQGTWPLNRYPPISIWKNRLMDWYRKGPGSYEANCEPVKNVLQAMTTWGSPPGGQRVSLATYGFGWGGFIALRAANAEVMSPAPIKAGVAVYPELFSLDQKIAADIELPVAILPAKHGPMERTMLALQETKPELFKRCLFKRAGKPQRGYATWALELDPVKGAQGWEFIRFGLSFIEHAWEDKVYVPPDEKGYKNQLDGSEGSSEEEDEEEEDEEGGQEEEEEQQQQEAGSGSDAADEAKA